MRTDTHRRGHFIRFTSTLLSLMMILFSVQVWAADVIVDTAEYNTVKLLAEDTLTVQGTGSIEVDEDDAEVLDANPGNDDVDDNAIIAVRGDDVTSPFVYNATVTVNSGGSIIASAVYNAAETPSLDTFVRAIDADEGDMTITNNGTLDASIELDSSSGSLDGHAMGIQLHNDNSATVAAPVNMITNSGDILASAINYNSAGGEVAARGIQVGGTGNSDLGEVDITNSGLIDADAEAYYANAIGIKFGGASGSYDLYNTSIINSGEITAESDALDEGSARAIKTGGYLDGLTIKNTGKMTADSSTDSVDNVTSTRAHSNARVIHTGGYMTDYEVINSGDMTANAFATGDEDDSDLNANARAIHMGESNTNVDITNSGNMIVNAAVFGVDGVADYLSSSADANARGIHMGGGNDDVSITNSGNIDVDATADANTDSSVDVQARGLHLGGDKAASNLVLVDNSGTLTVTATGTADEKADSGVNSNARGIHLGMTYNAAIINSNLIDVDATSTLVNSATDKAAAHAEGVHVVWDTRNLDITNSGTMNVDAAADAEDAYDGASSSAFGIKLGYNIENATITSNNLTVSSSAIGEDVDYYHHTSSNNGPTYIAVGSTAKGIMVAYDSTDVSIESNNLTVSSYAEGTDLNHSSYGHATTSARGIQVAYNATNLDITNKNAMTIKAEVLGEDVKDAQANARAIQIGGEGTSGLTIDNLGTIDVDAIAKATDAEDVKAHADGIKMGEDSWNDVSDVTITNDGTLDVSAKSSGGDINTSEASATGIKTGYDFDDLVIENNKLIQVAADASGDSASADANGVHISYNTTKLDVDNNGQILVDSIADEESNAVGIKVSKDSEGDVTNNGSIAVTAFSRSDYNAIARGLHIGEQDTDPDAGLDITNKAGASISAMATSDFDGIVGAYGIQAGYNAIGLITNDGTIEAKAYGGEEGKAIGVKAEHSFDLVNNGTIETYLDINYADDVDESYSIGIFASKYSHDKVVDITNNSKIIVDTDFKVSGDLADNAMGSGIKVAEFGDVSVVNNGSIDVDSEFYVTETIEDNTGSAGIRTGYLNTSTDTTNVTNAGTINVDTTIEALLDIEDSVGAYGIRSGQTSSGFTSITNESSGKIVATATVTSPEINYSTGAFGIKVGDGFVTDGVYNTVVVNDGAITATATINTDFTDSGEKYNRGAFGIRTGTAKVVNNKTISATATFNGENDSAYDGAYGIRTGEGDALVINTGTISASVIDNDTSTIQRAVGIMTGRGDNEIHQSGVINTSATDGETYAVVMGCEGFDSGDNALMVMAGAQMDADLLNAADTGNASVLFGLEADADGMADFGVDYANASELLTALDTVTDAAGFDAAMANVGLDESFTYTHNYEFLADSAGWDVYLMGGMTTINNSDESALDLLFVAPDTGLAGNIAVAGEYTQLAGGTYYAAVGFNATDAISADTATIEDGALIDVTAAGYVADGDIFTVVEAPSGLTGFYDDADLSYDSIVIDYALVDDSDDTVKIEASRTPYMALGLGANASAAAEALADQALSGDADANALIGMLDSMGNIADMMDGLGAICPEQYPALLDIGQAGNAAFGSVVSGRMGNLHIVRGSQEAQYASNLLTEDGPVNSRLPAFDRRGEGWSSWARLFSLDGEQDKDGGLSGYEFDTVGIAFGFDNKLNENVALGFGLGYADSDADFDEFNQTSDLESLYGSVYGTYSTGAYYIDGALTYASNDYDSDRVIPLMGLTAEGDTDGTEWGIMVGAGYNMVDNEAMYFIPTASIRWAQLDIDGFTEKGAGGLNLDIDDYDTDSFTTSLGFRWGAKMGKNVTFEPELRLAWAHEFGDTDREVDARFVGSTSTFKIESAEPDEDSALIGLGVNIFMNNQLTLYLDYDGEIRSDYDSHAFSAGMRYDF